MVNRRRPFNISRALRPGMFGDFLDVMSRCCDRGYAAVTPVTEMGLWRGSVSCSVSASVEAMMSHALLLGVGSSILIRVCSLANVDKTSFRLVSLGLVSVVPRPLRRPFPVEFNNG